ncbi:MAG: hypothetical protein ACHQUC_05930 [Chlamydiales bacterium]
MNFISKWRNIAIVAGSLLAYTSAAFASPIVQISPSSDPLSAYAECLLVGPESVPTPGSTAMINLNNTSGSLIAINPKNQKLMFAPMSQDNFESTSTSIIGFPFSIEIVVAFTRDGGKTWGQRPANFNLCLGGTVSDSIALRSVAYTSAGGKDGTAFIGGTFNDFRSGIHSTPLAGVFVSRSKDGGQTWIKPQIIATGISIPDLNVTGTSVESSVVAVDPVKKQNVYVTYTSICFPSTFCGNLFFARSNNLGETFSSPQQIYTITQDISNNFASIGGGQVIAPDIVVLASNKKEKHAKSCRGERAIIVAFTREYPPAGVNCYSQNIIAADAGITPSGVSCNPKCTNTIVDHAIVRSFDGGKTWSEHAIPIAPYVFAPHFVPAAVSTLPPILIGDGAINIALAVDQQRGRIYAVYQAGHSTDVSCPFDSGQRPQIWLSFSDDKGSTWSTPSVVSRTTVEGATGDADQAFNPNVAVSDDGTVAVGYYDFRNFEKGSSFVATDAWVAEYRPTCDGIAFCQEFKLTESSFDSSSSIENPLFTFLSDNPEVTPPSIPVPSASLFSLGSTIGLANQGKKFVTTFQTLTSEFNPYSIVAPGYMGLTNDNTDPNAIIDFNNYVNCFFRKVKSCGIDRQGER